MALLENAVTGWLTVFAFLLTVVALLAYRRSRNRKMLGIAAAFGLFFVKGVAVTYALFTATSLDTLWVPMALFDTFALLGFYLSALKS
jgi:DMSO reductase anchor subunit